MSYSVRIKRSAARELAKTSRQDRLRIVQAIDALSDNPLAGSPMKGQHRGLRRMRVGDWRIVYEVLDDVLVVLVVRVGHRSVVYRRR